MNRGLDRRVQLGAALGAIVLALALWELLGRTDALGKGVLPSFTSTASALGKVVGTSKFWSAVADTLVQWAVGLVCAIAVAVPVGLIIGSGRLRHRATRTSIDFLRTIPPVMLLPLFVLVWGTGLRMVVLLTVYAAVWPMLTQTISGVRQIEQQTLDTITIFRISPWRRFWKVLLPAVSPFIVSGVRVSAILSLFIAIVCELIAGSPGLGQLLASSQLSGDNALMVGLIAVTGIIGIVINMAFLAGESRLLAWHPSHAKGE